MCFVTGDFKGQKGKSLISKKKPNIRYISELWLMFPTEHSLNNIQYHVWIDMTLLLISKKMG